jgi:hypothetical protein
MGINFYGVDSLRPNVNKHATNPHTVLRLPHIAFATVPPAKILMGINSYGVDFVRPAGKDKTCYQQCCSIAMAPPQFPLCFLINLCHICLLLLPFIICARTTVMPPTLILVCLPQNNQLAVPPAKILMGINFYGVDFVRPAGKDKKAEPQRKPLIAPEFLAMLEKEKPKLAWDAESAEHMLKYKVCVFAASMRPAAVAAAAVHMYDESCFVCCDFTKHPVLQSDCVLSQIQGACFLLLLLLLVPHAHLQLFLHG